MKKQKKKMLFLINGHSGKKNAHKHIHQILQKLERGGIHLQLMPTSSPGQIKETVQHADFSQWQGIIIAGGDGTLYEAINGYMKNRTKPRIPLGIIPLGTGNAFARDIGLKNKGLHHAVKIILGGKTKRVDLARFRTKKTEHFFCNILGSGLIADINKTAQPLKKFGGISYVLSALYHLIFLRSQHLEMTIDGKTIERDNVLVEIANTRFTGKDMLVAPKARLDDGLLDVIVVNRSSRFALLKALAGLSKGTHIHMKGIETFVAKKIVLKTEMPTMLSPDGEIFGSTPVEIECLPKALTVFST